MVNSLQKFTNAVSVEGLVQVNVLRVVGDEGLVRPDLRVDAVCQLGQFAQLLLRVAATNIVE